jgi:hypothetical protein
VSGKLLADQSATPVATADVIATDNQNTTSAKSAAEAAQSDLSQKQQAMIDVVNGNSGSSSADTKNDALSVYGTFSTNSSAGVGSAGPSASAVIGKTFSTGIAAQNLTQGLKVSAQVAAAANCLAAVHSLAADGVAVGKPIALDAMISLCGATQK